jgi:hypothetical protein
MSRSSLTNFSNAPAGTKFPGHIKDNQEKMLRQVLHCPEKTIGQPKPLRDKPPFF